ncbi:hypothetical protein C8R46DRAFT_1098975 [Mycena filopes]|nr:hypothetical protein C8R46DRAFT_1098975 [Mycena filopes]
MSYTFQGTSVFLALRTANAWYTVTIDDEVTTYGASGTTSSPTPSNCSFGWTKQNMGSTPHLLQIDAYGASGSSGPLSGRAAADGAWALEVQNLVVTRSDGSSSGSVSGTGGVSAGDSGGASAKSGLIYTGGWMMIPLAVFSFLATINFL